jgi:triphosphoribosyl-dephospho-CoA synthetase
MTVNNDSNILYRSNLNTLNQFKILSKKAIENKKSYNYLCDFCKINNISPGGSADLLSVTLLLYFVKIAQL